MAQPLMFMMMMIFYPDKVAILFSADLLCLLNCIRETIQVTDSRWSALMLNLETNSESERDSYSSARNRVINLEPVT
jgi:hypothetical protein